LSTYAIAVLPLAIWLYLAFGRGGFWRVQRSAPAPATSATPARRVVIVMPARDEAPVIAAAVASLLRQRFAGDVRLIVIDDGSTDGTAELVRAAAAAQGCSARVAVLAGTELPRGWTGKLWAMAQGVRAAARLGADYLLFTDADIEHGPDSVAALVAYAEAQRLDLVSHMARLSCASPAERLLIPAFVFFFFMIYPPAWVASPRSRLAAAAGGCLLVRPGALERSGGLQSIRSCIIDDCALARAVKDHGGRIALQLAHHTRSLRSYGSCGEIGDMIARTAFAQLRHSYLALAATLLGMLVTFMLPVVLLGSAQALAMCVSLAALLTMSLCYLPMVRFYGLHPAWCLSLPGAALYYSWALVRSALRYARGTGGRWKGRVQDA
jgi:hopene-associated glycosyltransferase HpnB